MESILYFKIKPNSLSNSSILIGGGGFFIFGTPNSD